MPKLHIFSTVTYGIARGLVVAVALHTIAIARPHPPDAVLQGYTGTILAKIAATVLPTIMPATFPAGQVAGDQPQGRQNEEFQDALHRAPAILWLRHRLWHEPRSPASAGPPATPRESIDATSMVTGPANFARNVSDSDNMHAIVDDHICEECGIFAIGPGPHVAEPTALGLHALQHRGQEATGMAIHDGTSIRVYRDKGLVGDVFAANGKIDIANITGNMAIGHNRYSTTAAEDLRSIQPLYADLPEGGISLAHNGHITNAPDIRRDLSRKGAIFHSSSDTETLIHLIAHTSGSIPERIANVLPMVTGAYALVCLHNGGITAARDPLGIRPLILGRRDASHILCSETVALDIIGAEYVRDVGAGEIITIDPAGHTSSTYPFGQQRARPCLFEYVYFSRPESVLDGISVYEARKNSGRMLAQESPCEADLIVPVPDSGVPAALGFAQKIERSAGIRDYSQPLCRPHIY